MSRATPYAWLISSTIESIFNPLDTPCQIRAPVRLHTNTRRVAMCRRASPSGWNEARTSSQVKSRRGLRPNRPSSALVQIVKRCLLLDFQTKVINDRLTCPEMRVLTPLVSVPRQPQLQSAVCLFRDELSGRAFLQSSLWAGV